MKIKKSQIRNILYFIFIFDLMLLPVMHPWGIPFKISYVFIAITLVVKFFQTMLRKSTKIDKNVFLLITISILILIGWLYFINVQSSTNISNTVRSIIILLLGVGGYYIATNFKFKKIYFIFPLLCCILSLSLIWLWDLYPLLRQFYHVEHRGLAYMQIRNAGIWGNPNASALNANLILIFSLLGIKEVFKTSKKLPILKILSFLILPTFITVFLTESRSGMLCFILIFIIFYFSKFYSISFNRKIVYSFTAIYFVLIFFLSINYALPTSTKISYFKTAVRKAPLATTARINNFYKSGVRRILASPIIGSGTDISRTKPYNDIGFHNDYLVLWASGGILSFVLYLTFVYFVIKTDALLLAPFLFPALTNAFLLHILAFITICFLYSYRKHFLKRDCLSKF